MHLAHRRHLAYSTNIHRGETWAETFAALQTHTLAVKARVCPPGEPYGIGLRLSDLASRELTADPTLRVAFRRWLDEHGCYVFTINGFPFGRFHGTRVKTQVYQPDWTTDARLEYTCRLFDLLAEWLPAGVGGSVSTVPGSFKDPTMTAPASVILTQAMQRQLWRCGEHIRRTQDRTGHALLLALEPEPLCWFENTQETLDFFVRLGPGLPIGVCFDTCHFAVEYEQPRVALDTLTAAGISVAKLHLSSALTLRPTPAARSALGAFRDEVYLHQTIIRPGAGSELVRWPDLDGALVWTAADAHPEWRFDYGGPDGAGEEWRIHYHIPLHSAPTDLFGTTAGNALGALDWLAANPGLCPHVEMETYTWEVLPPELRAASVEDQLAREYAWTFERLRERSMLP